MLAEITSRMIDRNSNATRLVEKLRHKGLVNREVCTNNRRQLDISVTDAGLEVLRKIDEGRDQWLEKLITIPKPEVVELNNLLDRLRG
jgi:DNA-binding MarR family transcriptional regulator